MSDYNIVNGTGENKHKSSCQERSAEMSNSPKTSAKDESPKAGDKKSPKVTDEVLKCFESTPDKDKTGPPKDFSDIEVKFEPDLESSESFPEETSSEILGEDTPEKDKSSESFAEDIHLKERSELLAKDTLDKDSEKNISDVSVGDVSLDISKSATVPAEKKAAKDKLLESAEKRQLRINRRGFHLQCASLDDSDQLKSEKSDKSSVVNLDASKKKIISLSSVKRMTSDNIPVDKQKKKIILKRKLSLTIEEEEKNEPTKAADDPPKKKKHKPITWP